MRRLDFTILFSFISEDILSEVFTKIGGPILTIRLSKKNFCHIRFASESSVDSSIKISGYRMRIGNQSDPPNTGKLHVDYAQVNTQIRHNLTKKQMQIILS